MGLVGQWSIHIFKVTVFRKVWTDNPVRSSHEVFWGRSWFYNPLDLLKLIYLPLSHKTIYSFLSQVTNSEELASHADKLAGDKYNQYLQKAIPNTEMEMT